MVAHALLEAAHENAIKDTDNFFVTEVANRIIHLI
jgi:hypothetical protein